MAEVRGRDDTPDSATRSTHRRVLLDQMGTCQCHGLRSGHRRAFGAVPGHRLAAGPHGERERGWHCQWDTLLAVRDLWRGRDRSGAVVLLATTGSLGQFVVSRDKPGLAGEYAESEARLNQALASFNTLDAHWQLGRTLFELGELARARTDSAAARDTFSKALAEFERLGPPRTRRERARRSSLWTDRSSREFYEKGHEASRRMQG